MDQGIDVVDCEADDVVYQKHLQNESYISQGHKYTISTNVTLESQENRVFNMEGWLNKKSPQLLMGWQKRYVKLKDGKLYYYKGLDQFKGCIDFHLIQVKVHAFDKNNITKEIRLDLIGTTKCFNFRSVDGENLQQWYKAIEHNILITNKYPKLKNIKCEEIWRHDRISNAQFKKEADTGDLLLFKYIFEILRGNSTMSKVQRALTGGDYDHVALMLRYNNAELFIFEAIGQTGVSLLSWDKFVQKKWHLLYQELVFRHLEIDRSDQLIENLEKFIKSNIGKKYQITAGKIIKRFSKSSEDIAEYEKDGKTFFCSELVAAAYKKMKILNQDKCAASYWPGIFSQNSKLKLINASLTQEQLIDFTIDSNSNNIQNSPINNKQQQQQQQQIN